VLIRVDADGLVTAKVSGQSIRPELSGRLEARKTVQPKAHGISDNSLETTFFGPDSRISQRNHPRTPGSQNSYDISKVNISVKGGAQYSTSKQQAQSCIISETLDKNGKVIRREIEES
jgi:hypothetical protein